MFKLVARSKQWLIIWERSPVSLLDSRMHWRSLSNLRDSIDMPRACLNSPSAKQRSNILSTIFFFFFFWLLWLSTINQTRISLIFFFFFFRLKNSLTSSLESMDGISFSSCLFLMYSSMHSAVLKTRKRAREKKHAYRSRFLLEYCYLAFPSRWKYLW